MKIVLLNTYKNGGGAAVACKRLFRTLTKIFPKDDIFIFNLLAKTESIKHEIGLENNLFQRIHNFFYKAVEVFYFRFFEKSKAERWSFSLGILGNNIAQHRIIKQADVLHFHWINHGFLSLKNIDQIISTNKKIIFTLHDMWLFTGGCHHSRTCSNYKTTCGSCMYLKNPRLNDLSTKILLKKIKLFKDKKNIRIVTCSNWLQQKAMESVVLRGLPIYSIPNPINQIVFQPQNLDITLLDKNLKKESFKILFGCANLNNKRKGTQYLVDALNLLHKNNIYNIQVLLIGQENSELIQAIPFETIYLGNINSEQKMAEIYSVADVFVLPSLEENLPNMLIESMACGISCVAFNVGGIPEIIQHKTNGYLAEYESVQDLADGIVWSMENKSEKLAKICIDYVTEHYSEAVVAKKYMEVYNS